MASERSSDGIVLVLGADDAFALPLAVTLYSALLHLHEQTVQVHVLDGGISPRNRSRIQRAVRRVNTSASVNWHHLDLDKLAGVRITRWGSTANYLRMLMPEILDDATPTAIYLDSDLLVRGNLSSLVDSTLVDAEPSSDRAAVRAVHDFRHADLGEVLGDQVASELGVDPRSRYFNSGVLVVSLEGWRELNVSERALAFARENASVMRYSDQDALNVVLAGCWEELDPRWNVMLPQVSTYLTRMGYLRKEKKQKTRELIEEAHVYHFIGPEKPWTARYRGPGRREYLDAVRQCGWFDGPISFLVWRFRLATESGFRTVFRMLPETFRSWVKTGVRKAATL